MFWSSAGVRVDTCLTSVRVPKCAFMFQRPVTSCDDCPMMIQGTCVFARKKVKANSVLATQGESPAEIGFVRDGIVALTSVDSTGQQTWAAMRGPRALLGFEALVQAHAECEVRTLTQVDVCGATPEAVRALSRSNAGAKVLLDLALTEVCEQRLDVGLRTGSIENRVARFALQFEQLVGSTGSVRPLSKAQVAAMIGIRPETLSRVLRRFHARGVLEVSKGIRVLQPGALRAMAQA